MRKTISLLWATALAACVPGYYTKDGCFIPQEEQTAWEAARSANTSRAYRAFLQSYPASCYAESATARLAVPVTPAPVKKITPKPVGGNGGNGSGMY